MSTQIIDQPTVLDRFRLDGRVAIVTGASSGLGVAFAHALAQAGADVALGARRVDRLEETRELVDATDRRAIAVATDVSRPQDCQHLVDATLEAFGRVDILVNNAGVASAVPATRETPEQFRQVLAVNLDGCYWMAQACGRTMQPGSAIVNVSSVLGLRSAGLPQAAYAASKAGLIGLTRDLAAQWSGRKGIRVNALAPRAVSHRHGRGGPRRPRARHRRELAPRPRRPAGRALRRAGVPGQRRVLLHHRHHPARRRRLDDALTD